MRSSRFQRIPEALRELTATVREPTGAAILDAMPVRWLVWSAALVVGIGGGVGLGAATSAPTPAAATPTIRPVPQAPNPNLYPGMRLNTVAPAFTLTDQFGRTV